MSIEFIKDDFLEGKKEELENIDKILSKKNKKSDKNAIFLKRFTFALMGQYKFQNKHITKKHEEIKTLNKQIIQGAQRINPPASIKRSNPLWIASANTKCSKSSNEHSPTKDS